MQINYGLYTRGVPVTSRVLKTRRGALRIVAASPCGQTFFRLARGSRGDSWNNNDDNKYTVARVIVRVRLRNNARRSWHTRTQRARNKTRRFTYKCVLFLFLPIVRDSGAYTHIHARVHYSGRATVAVERLPRFWWQWRCNVNTHKRLAASSDSVAGD